MHDYCKNFISVYFNNIGVNSQKMGVTQKHVAAN